MDRRAPLSQVAQAGPYFALFSEVGFVLAVPILAGVLLGNELDRSIGTWPIFLLVGAFAGMGLGGYACYRLISRFLARFDLEPRPPTEDRREGPGGEAGAETDDKQ